MTLAAGGLASLVRWLAAGPLLRVTYGAEFTGAAGVLGEYTGACTLIGALILLINHRVGRGADAILWAAAGLAVLQLLLFFVFHGSERTIIAVDATTGGAGPLIHECMFFRSSEAIVPGPVRATRLFARRRVR